LLLGAGIYMWYLHSQQVDAAQNLNTVGNLYTRASVQASSISSSNR
jgi:hypothetical protein